MMEYQAIVKVGKRNVNVHFTEGSATAIGANPATFTTDSIIIQHAIENSGDYKSGRIRKLRTIDLDEELEIERGGTPEANGAAEKGNKPNKPDGSDEVEAAEAAAPGQIDDDESEETAMTQVEFSCNDDAKDYLEQTFGYIRSKLKNREDIVNAGKAHGVEIIFV